MYTYIYIYSLGVKDYNKNGLTRGPEFGNFLYFRQSKYSRTGLLGYMNICIYVPSRVFAGRIFVGFVVACTPTPRPNLPNHVCLLGKRVTAMLAKAAGEKGVTSRATSHAYIHSSERSLEGPSETAPWFSWGNRIGTDGRGSRFKKH